MSGLLYIGVLLAAYSLLMLPFHIYATFVIEERFGFNRTTLRTFALDRFKGVGLVLLIGTPLLGGVLALFQYARPYAWLYCWVAVTMFSLAVQFVAPTWIMPLFNKFIPMEPGELKEAILNYSRSVKFPVKNVLVMDGSRRSINQTPSSPGLVATSGLLSLIRLSKKHSTPELVAILGHEIGHYKKKHILQGIITGTLHTGIMLFLLSIFLDSPGLYHAFYMEQQSVYAGLLFFGLLYTPVEMLLSIALRMLSRRNEYQADRFAVETIAESGNLVSALKKLSADNLSNLTPHPFYVFLNHSHPPLLQRIRAIRRYGGITGAPSGGVFKAVTWFILPVVVVSGLYCVFFQIALLSPHLVG